ncbi:MAG: YggS family pyridoxal phosphate-dependent enzyme [Alphaproteobacteria bacterium]|nr:YggS family pyridoxal phosphate-dependent enzyme [Alphaproteobacteria bacterium]
MADDQGQVETGTPVADHLIQVRETIAEAAKAAGRNPEDVTLVAVSKAQPDERVLAALEAGQRVFGENYVQPALARWPHLKERYPDVRLHMIGAIQSRKAKDVVGLFDMLETIDREKLARAIAKEMAALDRWPACLIQVNTGEEPQKAGVHPRDADAFVAFCRDELSLPVKGLMCVPPVDDEPAMHFALLAKIARRNDLQILSMGMSADFEVGVQFGATHVRVGSAIFGARAPKS